jgi:hypothetical protein
MEREIKKKEREKNKERSRLDKEWGRNKYGENKRMRVASHCLSVDLYNLKGW